MSECFSVSVTDGRLDVPKPKDMSCMSTVIVTVCPESCRFYWRFWFWFWFWNIQTKPLTLFIFSSGMFGTNLLDFNRLSSSEPVAENSHGYHGNRTNKSVSSWSLSSLETENITSCLQNHAGEVAYHSQDTPSTNTAAPPASSSQAPPTPPYTKLPDWLASVTSLSTTAPISSTTSAPDTGNYVTVRRRETDFYFESPNSNRFLFPPERRSDTTWRI